MEAWAPSEGIDMGTAKSKEEIFALFNVNPNTTLIDQSISKKHD